MTTQAYFSMYVEDVMRRATKYCEAGHGLCHKFGQATKGVWWMPRQKMAMKDVVSCDNLRGAAKQASIRRSPNQETVFDESQRILI